jgi:hypothetical protein
MCKLSDLLTRPILKLVFVNRRDMRAGNHHFFIAVTYVQKFSNFGLHLRQWLYWYFVNAVVPQLPEEAQERVRHDLVIPPLTTRPLRRLLASVLEDGPCGPQEGAEFKGERTWIVVRCAHSIQEMTRLCEFRSLVHGRDYRLFDVIVCLANVSASPAALRDSSSAVGCMRC